MNAVVAWFLLITLGLSFATHVVMLCFLWLPSTNNAEGKVIVYTNHFGERDGEILILVGILAFILAACWVPINELRRDFRGEV